MPPIRAASVARKFVSPQRAPKVEPPRSASSSNSLYLFSNLRPRFRCMCCILAFGPGKHAIPKWCAGRKWLIPMASNRKRSRGRIKADEMRRGKNSHGTFIDWCTGREWPLNCMTIISAWWWSNMPFQRSSRRLSGRWTIILLSQDKKSDSCSWSCWYDVVGKATPGRRSPWSPWWVGVQRSCWQDAVKNAILQQRAGPLGFRLSVLENEKDTTLTAIRVGVKILQFLFGLQLPITRKPWVTLFEPLQ